MMKNRIVFMASPLLPILLLAISIGRSAPRPDAQVGGSKQYTFTSDWVSSNIPVWKKVMAPYAGRSDVRYLEVGVFEGRSVIWMLENILVHPTCKITAVDSFPEDLLERFEANIGASGQAAKVTVVKGVSQEVLRGLELDSQDIIYVDGGHTADMVLADAVLCWGLLKTGGLLVFDDYRWKRGEFPDELRPGPAIDGFITAFRNYLDIVHREYQTIVRKKNGPPLYDPYRTILGGVAYAWQERQLRREPNEEVVNLSAEERDLLETILRSRPFGETRIVLHAADAADPQLLALTRKLKIDFDVDLFADGGSGHWVTLGFWTVGFILGIASTLLLVRLRRSRR